MAAMRPQVIHIPLLQYNTVPLKQAEPNYFVPYHLHKMNEIVGLSEYLSQFITPDTAYDLLAEIVRQLPDPTNAINIGSGVGLYKIKDGYILQFKSIKPATTNVSITEDVNGNVLIDAIGGDTDGGEY